ncbi:hypothetical protein EGW08_009949 [Elysia chlorotica]|uniref:Amine oxidase domain-containing protein n=1 Tax=Elysia chlorotica TaxID=188477 RepID=A0A433TL94_ELYCH|nr:hypothetical protein EGW08_009949 [Elysia chlorotica]
MELSPSTIRPWCLALTVVVFSAVCSARLATNNLLCAIEHDVAIIGAGISGSYSAYKLRNEGLDIGMYEYSNRIGGRIYTEQLPNEPDQNLELGGMAFVDGFHVLVQNHIRNLNLSEKIALFGNDATYPDRVFRRGVSMTNTEFSTGDVPYNLTAEEKAQQPVLLKYMFQKLTNDPLDNVTEDSVFELKVPDGRKLYTLSAREALGLVASPDAVRYLLDETHYDSDEVSAVNLVYETFGAHVVHFDKDDVHTMEEGYDQMVKDSVRIFLEASFNHSIEMNMKLEAIRGTPGDYVLQFRRTVTVDDQTLELHNRESISTVCAKKVILGLAKYGLSQVDWSPLRSRHYKDLLAGTFSVHASKVFMTYESPWWLEQSKYPSKLVSASGLGRIYDWGVSNATGHHTLLVSFTQMLNADKQWVTNSGLSESLLDHSIGGSLDFEIENPLLVEPDSKIPRIPGSVYGENRLTAPLKEHLYTRLAKVFGIPRCGIPDPLSSIARFWLRYPFGGGWVLVRPGYTYNELINGYRRPSDTDDIFVVGTDYSTRDTYGWAEGALWTVERVMEQFFLP